MATGIVRAHFIRVAPRKLRLVADSIRGKKVAEARAILQYMPKAAAPVLKKVLESAVANAEHEATETRRRIDTDEMYVTKLLIDGAFMLKRVQPRARGRRCLIRRRTSHITLEISDVVGASRS